jgi:predicted Holliday junction resolvase-like endonuclease|tara:strand:+ start:25 stop:648 length:624 start_codon:yes stop_codon:yes gene_type:complete
LEFLLEFFCCLSIICVFILTFYVKTLKSNADSLKADRTVLQDQLTQKSSSFLSRESEFTKNSLTREAALNKNISKLQEILSEEQRSIKTKEAQHTENQKKLLNDVNALQKTLAEEEEARKKILSQKKSSEVRLGNIAEKLAPFLDQFDFNPENCIFLGQPIDYISFDDDLITIIEVKSGKSQLNTKQRHIRDLIKAKQVAWKEIRIH